MPLLFVYGTLKRKESNHHMILEHLGGTKFDYVGEGRLLEKYPFYIFGEQSICAMMDIPGQGKRVYGEIYEVDDYTLKVMDDYERCPWYNHRNLVKVEVATDDSTPKSKGVSKECYIYMCDPDVFKPELLDGNVHDKYHVPAGAPQFEVKDEESFSGYVRSLLKDTVKW